MLQAREKLTELYSYDASNIGSLYFQAYEDIEAAKELESKWLMKEAESLSRKMK